jgi:ABC-type antimicrobial peptide transport system permease subunit
MYNIKQRWATSLKIAVGFTSICILITTFFTYNLAINRELAVLINESASDNYIYIQEENALSEQDMNFLKALDGVNEVITEGIIHDNDLEYELIFDGNKYIIENVLCIFSREETELISKNEYLEFNNRFKGKEILYGRAAKNEHEAVVTFNILKILGLGVNNVIGKTIKLPVFEESFIIVGVFSDEYEYLSSVLDYTVNYFVNIGMNNFRIKTTKIFLSSYNGAEEIINKISSHFNGKYVAVYSGDYIKEYYTIFEKQRTLCNEIMLIAGGLLLVALLVNLFTILIYDIKRKGIYFGVMKAQGMTSGGIYLTIFTELVILFIAAAISGVFFSSFLVNLLGTILTSGLYVELTVSLTDYLPIGGAVLCGGVILLASLSYMLLRIHTKKDVVKQL